MKNEKDVKRKVKALLEQYDWFYFMPPANAYGKSGIADIIAIWNGTFLAVETKFGSNKPTAMQIGFLNSIRASQGFAFVVSDRNIGWFEGFLESFKLAAEAHGRREPVPPEHGARLLNAIAELSNKLLDTTGPSASLIPVVPESVH
jgi:hypothetical protein